MKSVFVPDVLVPEDVQKIVVLVLFVVAGVLGRLTDKTFSYISR